MLELKNEKVAIPLVLFAGILWSFGPLVVRYIDQPELVPWLYLLGRGITIFLILNIYLFFEEGISFYKNYKKIGLSGLIGGIGLGIAMISASTAQSELKDGIIKTINLSNLPIVRQWFLINLQETNLDPDVMMFKKFLLENKLELMPVK